MRAPGRSGRKRALDRLQLVPAVALAQRRVGLAQTQRAPHAGGRDEQADHAEEDAALQEADPRQADVEDHEQAGADERAAVVQAPRLGADHDQPGEHRGHHHRIQRRAALVGPVDVLQAHPQRELVQREARADAEPDRGQLPPRAGQLGGEGDEPAHQQQHDAPHQVVQVDAALGLHATRPPRHRAGQPRAGADEAERAQEGQQHQEGGLVAGLGHILEHVDVDVDDVGDHCDGIRFSVSTTCNTSPVL